MGGESNKDSEKVSKFFADFFRVYYFPKAFKQNFAKLLVKGQSSYFTIYTRNFN